MKTPRLLACLLLLPAVLAAAPVNSTLSAVTVYLDRAVVTRTGTVTLAAGLNELTFENLPAALDEQSLQVSGRGTAQAVILDVRARQTFVDTTPNARVKELEDQLHALQRQARGLDDRKTLLDAQNAIFARMEQSLFAPPAKDVPRPDLNQFSAALVFLTEQKTRLLADHAALDEQREELQRKIQTLESQLAELRLPGARSYRTVSVRVSAAQGGTLELALAYSLPGATWVPGYDARVASSERTVTLGYFGHVRQQTGEDWKDVALTLSTARPGLGGAAPVLTPWTLDVWQPPPVAAGKARQAMASERDRSGKAEAPDFLNMQRFTTNALQEGAVPAPEERDAETAAATVEAGATSAVFKVAAPATIPSDNAPQKVPIATVRLAATPEYLTVPRHQAVAYLTSKVVNSSDYPLLAGSLSVFLDGTFVATSALRTVMPGEKFDLALGADEGIGVKYRRVQKFTEDTGLTKSGKRLTYEYLLTLQNNKKTDQRVIVVDQVPLSRNEKIVVKVLAPDAREVKPTDEGALKWTLELKPGEKRELPVKFTIDYPNDVVVSGLD